MTDVGTSIGFGGGDVIEVSIPLEKMHVLLQGCLTNQVLLEIKGMNGETVIINPWQVKVLQSQQPEKGREHAGTAISNLSGKKSDDV